MGQQKHIRLEFLFSADDLIAVYRPLFVVLYHSKCRKVVVRRYSCLSDVNLTPVTLLTKAQQFMRFSRKAITTLKKNKRRPNFDLHVISRFP